MAEKKQAAVSTDAPGTVATGDHTAVQLVEQSNYRDNPDKPAPESVAQVQDVPDNWPGASAPSDESR